MKHRVIFVGILLFIFFAGKGGIPGNKINMGEYFSVRIRTKIVREWTYSVLYAFEYPRR